MMNIGIIGSESSHAMQFAKYFNLPDPQTGKIRHSDIRVTSIMGDAESAKKQQRTHTLRILQKRLMNYYPLWMQ